MSYSWPVIIKEFSRLCQEYYGFPENYSNDLLIGIRGIKGAKFIFNDLFPSDRGKTDDLIAELRYVYLFLNCGWIVEKIPRGGGRTPDLMVVSDSFSSLVEIKHIRWRNLGPSLVDNNEEIELLEEYSNFEKNEQKIRDTVFIAVDQIYLYENRNPNDIPIIALWSSDGAIDELDIRSSMNRIIDEIRDQKPNFPNGILIFGSEWISRYTKYHSYPIYIREPFDPILKETAIKISSLH